ncbi:hypothetical protein HYR54_07465 [Candidatus Acetothermia bacterium]|nr:hypothetical protein [Candidatus Acetothermia bacterium]
MQLDDARDEYERLRSASSADTIITKKHDSYAADMVEQFHVLRETLHTLNRRLTDCQSTAHRHRREAEYGLRSFSLNLEEHRKLWREVESNPTAGERRKFLEGQLNRLKEQLFQIDWEALELTVQLERDRDKALLDYLELRRTLGTLKQEVFYGSPAY